jgi:enoyl-CoA hydratase
MSEEPHLLTEVVENILIATFNRPEKLNAMSFEMVDLIEQAVHRFRDTPELRVLLLKSKGRYFSAGADLKQGDAEGRPQPTMASEVRESHRRLPMRRVWDEMEGIEKPVVVAHHARCVGGSLEMSLSCDFRLAAASASYAFPEAKFGVLPATNGVSRLVRIIGPHWARYMIMANIPLESQEALNAGLVHKVGAAKVAIELAKDLGAHQAASVERLVNSSIMTTQHYRDLTKAHIANIGKGKGY